MKPGDIVLIRFPQTDLKLGKLRPALVVAVAPSVINARLGDISPERLQEIRHLVFSTNAVCFLNQAYFLSQPTLRNKNMHAQNLHRLW